MKRIVDFDENFLRHVERTKVLVHILDVQPEDGSDPATNYKLIRKELAAYSPVLAEREEIIVLNKLDLLPASDRDDAVKRLRAKLKLGREVEVLGVSAAARSGTRELLELLWRLLNKPTVPWSGVNEPAVASASAGPEPVAAARPASARRQKLAASPRTERTSARTLKASSTAKKARGATASKGAAKASVARRLAGAAARRSSRGKAR